MSIAFAHHKALLEVQLANLAEANTAIQGLLDKLSQAAAPATAGGTPATATEIAFNIGVLRKRGKRHLGLLESTLDKWREDIHALGSKSTERKVATEELEQLATGEDGYPAVMARANSLLAKLEDASDRKGAQSHSDRSNRSANISDNESEREPRMELPEWKIPKFNGDPKTYLQWWEAFKECVHKLKISRARKCYHLVGSLEGEAKRAIAGFSPTAANYPLILARIQSKWGDNQVLAAQLNHELLQLEPPSNNVSSLDQFSDEIERILGQLLEVRPEEGVDNDAISTVIKTKLPAPVREALAVKEIESGEYWNTSTLREKLQAYIKVRKLVKGVGESQPKLGNAPNQQQSSSKSRDSRRDRRNRDKPALDTRTFAAVARGEPAKKVYPCLFCDSNEHISSKCPQYPAVDQRRRRLNDKKVCMICLRADHTTLDCTSGKSCNRCNGAHHYLLCSQKGAGKPKGKGNAENKPKSKGTSATSGAPSNPKQTTSAVTQCTQRVDHTTASATSNQPRKRDVLMMARHAEVKASPHGQRTKKALIFFDSGSELSYITDKLAKELNLQRAAPCELRIEVFGGQAPTSLSTHFYKAFVQTDEQPEPIYLASTPRIVKSIRSLRLGGPDEEPQSQVLEEPELLIGAGDWPRWVKGVKPFTSELLHCDTIIGPVIMGAAPLAGALANGTIATTAASVAAAIDCQAIDFSSLEALGISDDPNSQDSDSRAREHFLATVRRKPNGRIVVSFPWIEEMKRLLRDNYKLAIHITTSLLQRLQAKPQLLEQYDRRVRDMFTDGTTEKSRYYGNGKEHFLTHHPVVVEKAPGVVKMRIVQNGSLSTRYSPSLNECLLRGPIGIVNLVGMLIRLRWPTVAVLSDIEKAFLMLELNEPDRDYTKFLWPIDIAQPLTPANTDVYRFVRLSFGFTPAPSLLDSALNYQLSSFNSPVAREIEGNVYVDNILLSADNSEEAIAKCKAAKSMLAEAKMNLREFLSNSAETMAAIPEQDRLGRTAPKVLGVIWDTERDSLSFPMSTPPRIVILTSRVVAGEMASVFNPLGYLCPCLLGAKCFTQKLWDKSRGWDDPLSPEEAAEWDEIIQPWEGQAITVARRLTQPNPTSLQLHVFVDASDVAYACAVYLRSEGPGGVVCNLVYARNRLIPRKGMSTPRAELTAAATGINGIDFVEAQLHQPIESMWFWGDNKAVLGWIANGGEKQPRFIVNRVAKIRQSRCEFRYVNTSENPADIPTRGCPPSELREWTLWWNGPEWLAQSPTQWPTDLVVPRFSEAEEWPTTLVAATTAMLSETEPIMDPFRFSSWRSAQNCYLWVARFVSSKLKRSFPTGMRLEGPFTGEEYQLAELSLLRTAQRENPPTPKEIAAWRLRVDTDGLLRKTTRIGNANAPVDTLRPVLVPHSHWLTLLVRHIHRDLLHQGVDATATELLQRFWTPQARRQVKKALASCLHCQRLKAVPYALPEMPPLPISRVRQLHAFEAVGLDYLGPSWMQDKGVQEKCWVMLITCLCTRAVHLELIEDLSTITFLQAYRNFVAIRRKPTHIVSDNASQFKLAAKSIKAIEAERRNYEEWNHTIRQAVPEIAKQGTRWHFIPQLSPWAGGVYERLVQLVKKCFKATVGRIVLSRKEITVFITEVGAVLNQRPITRVDDSADGPVPLRPVDFLSAHASLDIGQALDFASGEAYTEGKLSSEKQLSEWWESSSAALNQFWQRWHREYLILLRERSQFVHKGPRSQLHRTPRVGEVVMVDDNKTPHRSYWPLGVVNEVDASGRHAQVNLYNAKTKKRYTLCRPVCNLYPLEAAAGEVVPGIAEADPEAITNRPEQAPVTALDQTPPAEPESSSPSSQRARRVRPAKRRAKQRLAELFAAMALMLICLPTTSADTWFRYLWGGMGDGPTPPPKQRFYCNECTTRCTMHGLEIHSPPSVRKVEACCQAAGNTAEECYVFGGRGEFHLHHYLVLQNHSCTLRFHNEPDGKTWDTNIQCGAVEYCRLSTCFWCTSSFQCHPRWMVITVGMAAFGLLTALCYLARGCRTMAGKCSRCCYFYCWCCSWCRCRPTRVPREEEYELISPDPAFAGVRFKRVKSGRKDKPFKLPKIPKLGRLFKEPKVSIAIVAVCVLAWTIPGQADHVVQASSEQCHSRANGSHWCEVHLSTTITLLPRGQDTKLIAKSQHGTVGTVITLTGVAETLRCVRRNRGHSFSYRVDLNTTLRCPGKGTCSENKCSDLKGQDPTEETDAWPAANHPGWNFCRASSCVGLKCLCGDPFSAACIVGRTYATPTSNHSIEWFDCPVWKPTVQVVAKLETESSWSQTTLRLSPGTTVEWGNFSLTSFPGGRNPSPLYDTLFATDGYRVVVAEHLPRDLACKPGTGPLDKSRCSLQPSACTDCRATSHTTVHCDCRSLDWEKIVTDDQRLLPLATAVGLLTHEEKQVWMRVSTTPLQISITGTYHFAPVEPSSKCEVNVKGIEGYYASALCAQVTYQCHTDFGSLMVEADCGNTTMVLHCSNNTEWRNSSLCYDRALVRLECQARCPANNAGFRLYGELAAVPLDESGNFESVAGRHTETEDKEDIMSKLRRWEKAFELFLNYAPYMIGVTAVVAALAGLKLLILKIKVHMRIVRLLIGLLLLEASGVTGTQHSPRNQTRTIVVGHSIAIHCSPPPTTPGEGGDFKPMWDEAGASLAQHTYPPNGWAPPSTSTHSSPVAQIGEGDNKHNEYAMGEGRSAIGKGIVFINNHSTVDSNHSTYSPINTPKPNFPLSIMDGKSYADAARGNIKPTGSQPSGTTKPTGSQPSGTTKPMGNPPNGKGSMPKGSPSGSKPKGKPSKSPKAGSGKPKGKPSTALSLLLDKTVDHHLDQQLVAKVQSAGDRFQAEHGHGELVKSLEDLQVNTHTYHSPLEEINLTKGPKAAPAVKTPRSELASSSRKRPATPEGDGGQPNLGQDHQKGGARAGKRARRDPRRQAYKVNTAYMGTNPEGLRAWLAKHMTGESYFAALHGLQARISLGKGIAPHREAIDEACRRLLERLDFASNRYWFGEINRPPFTGAAISHFHKWVANSMPSSHLQAVLYGLEDATARASLSDADRVEAANVCQDILSALLRPTLPDAPASAKPPPLLRRPPKSKPPPQRRDKSPLEEGEVADEEENGGGTQRQSDHSNTTGGDTQRQANHYKESPASPDSNAARPGYSTSPLHDEVLDMVEGEEEGFVQVHTSRTPGSVADGEGGRE